MPLYRFIVCNGERSDDTDGVELANDSTARSEGLQIIEEIKRNNVASWAQYNLQVCDGERLVHTLRFSDTIDAEIEARRKAGERNGEN